MKPSNHYREAAYKMGKFYKAKDGIKIWYSFTKGRKPCIVFLHGLTGSSSVYGEYAKYFSEKGHAILLIDMRGQGYSDKTKQKECYSISLIADDLYNILKAEKIKKAIFVGHCYGGFVIQEFCKKHQGLVKRIIFISTSYTIRSRGIIFPLLVYQLYRLLSFFMAWAHLEKNKVHADYTRFAKSPDIDLSRLYLDISITSFQTFLPLLREQINIDNSDVLAKIDVPVLIIHGKHDLFLRKEDATIMNKLIRGSKLVLITAGHIPISTCSEKVKELISAFV